MPEPAYFETSAFIELLNTTANASDIRFLVAELQRSKTRIYTSILTVQEASILSFRRGSSDRDIYQIIAQFARIYSMDKAIALAVARLEASVRDLFNEGDEDKQEAKHRRRWDCIHIATAQVLGCRRFYAYDKHFSKRAVQLNLGYLEVTRPTATQPSLALQATQPALKLVKPEKE